MSIKLCPDRCLWCDNARVVDGSCIRCGTKYSTDKHTKRKRVKDDLVLGRNELKRLTKLRFAWEI